jgi:hypothetical protein
MRVKQALDWIKECGIAVESWHGDVPSLTEFITGEALKGSWWGHRKGHEIFRLSRAIRNSPDVVTCRVVEGRITYVHRRLWPALIKLAEEFSKERLAAVKETHTPSGKHEVTVTSFPKWVPKEVMKTADRLTQQEAAEQLDVLLRERGNYAQSRKPNQAIQRTAGRSAF